MKRRLIVLIAGSLCLAASSVVQAHGTGYGGGSYGGVTIGYSDYGGVQGGIAVGYTDSNFGFGVSAPLYFPRQHYGAPYRHYRPVPVPYYRHGYHGYGHHYKGRHARGHGRHGYGGHHGNRRHGDRRH
jgi:hypothetical protein